jgi:hypothetical protein
MLADKVREMRERKKKIARVYVRSLFVAKDPSIL